MAAALAMRAVTAAKMGVTVTSCLIAAVALRMDAISAGRSAAVDEAEDAWVGG